MSQLTGATVELGRLTEADLPELLHWHADPAFLRSLDARPAYPRARADLEAWLGSRQRAPDAFLFGVRTRSEGRLVGYTELDDILWHHGTAWTTLAIGRREDRGRGYGGEALRLTVGFAFGELNLRRLTLTVFDDNEVAIRLYERVGFRREGVYREFLHRDGEFHDMLLYGLLAREWRPDGQRLGLVPRSGD